MRRSASAEHFFTVRGRGFDDLQWEGILEATRLICERAKEAGIKASFEADAEHLEVSPEDGEPLVIWRKGEPGIPRKIKTEGMFDAVVQSVLAATKKIAPMLFEMTSPDGREYRRIFAEEWAKAKSVDTDQTKEEAFQEYANRKPWRNHETGNDVKYVSLPRKMQKELRDQWEIQFGRAFDEAKARSRDQQRQREKSPEKKNEEVQSGGKGSPKKAGQLSEETIRRAAIRVAAKTQDQDLKRSILEILRSANAENQACDDGKMSRHEEDSNVDVAAWLRDHGHTDAAAKWDKHHGQVGKAAALVFPEIHRIAQQAVQTHARVAPHSRTASATTKVRFAAAGKLAAEWIQDAIKHPGRVREYLGVPEGQTIPVAKLDAAISKVEKTGNKSLLAALLLAKRLKGMKG